MHPNKILIALMLFATQFANADEFAEYPVSAPRISKPAEVKLDTDRGRLYGTLLAQQAELGANFNGRFRAIHWGCGTNCAKWAVINLKTGDIWLAPDGLASCTPQGQSEIEPPDWLEMRVDSRLLYVYSCSDFPYSAHVWNQRQVYVWSDDVPELIRTENWPK